MGSRVLVTGHKGLVGPYVVRELQRQGHVVAGFDRTDGYDVRDPVALSQSMEDCDAVIHLAAADVPLAAEEVIEINLFGAKNVLDVAVAHGVGRVVIASSVDALGIFMGEASPEYLPIDDGHPARPNTPYGASKRAVELLAQRASATSDVEVICLRPPGVCDDAMMATIRSYRAERASYEWDPIWEYSAWIHTEDLGRALVSACFCPPPDDHYACLLVAASDVNSDEYSGRALSARVHPNVPWRGGAEYEANPWRSLIDSGPAIDLLGWSPQVFWRNRT